MADSIITKQELIDAQKDAQTLEEVISGEPGKLIETRLGRKVYTLASVPQINTMTREEVTAVVASRAPQETTYTKTEVDSALLLKAPQSNTYTKGEVDASLTAITGGHKAYGSLAAALANTSTFPQNSIIEITNDPDPSKNGTYQWNGADLTKSAYDPLAQAKADATAKANAAEANAKTYADNRTKLARPIVASNKVSRTIQNMENAQVTLGTQIVPAIVQKVGSFLYLVAVKPNTTYSLVSTVTNPPTVREFAAEPISEVSRLEALIGQTITMTTYLSNSALRRRGTFTTGENTNYITFDPRTYSCLLYTSDAADE